MVDIHGNGIPCHNVSVDELLCNCISQSQGITKDRHNHQRELDVRHNVGRRMVRLKKTRG